MTIESTARKITKQVDQQIGNETNRNKIFVVLLGFLILGMAFFGKIINDSANDAFDKVEQHFSLSNDYLSHAFNTYSCTVVDGMVKVAHGIKEPNEVLKELKDKQSLVKEKITYYLENSPCHKKDLLEDLAIKTSRTDLYLQKIITNFESQNGVKFANESLETGELYKYTDDILLTLNLLLECHLETARTENDKCQKSLKSFKRICIVSSSIGLTIIMAVIIKFFSEKNEIIQKRNSNSGSVPRRKPRKKNLQIKK